MEFERRKRRHTHIDTAPLVDVVFNLLLFFVITYNVTADPAIKVRLPEAATADAAAEEPLVITLERQGNVYVGEEATQREDIPRIVRQRLGEMAGPSVKIRADRDAPVGMLVAVVDGVKLAGCSAFSIVVEKN
ncbi:MAG TPA: biopolymer transporter ExbD [Syntrophobacteraceae bacterium]|nr:biopolymer transporter ExbD [Syntrophobacteraceae bacterium]